MTRPRSLAEAGAACLGIDGGATRTIAVAGDEAGNAIGRVEGSAANLRLVNDAELVAVFQPIARAFPTPQTITIGLAGAWDEPDRQRIRQAAAACWPAAACYATHDLEIALAAASPAPAPQTDVLVLSGTGSCCYGRNPTGRVAKIGGWGHLLGDQGSGYDLGLTALRAVAQEYDRSGRWPPLGAALLSALLLNEPNDLISWAQAAAKADIARLAVTVFAAAEQNDRLARTLVRTAASRLAMDASACAKKLAHAGQPVRFLLAGSVLREQAPFRSTVSRALRRLWPGASVAPLAHEPAWGAMTLAWRRLPATSVGGSKPPRHPRPPSLPTSRRLSPTEERNPLSARLDRLSLRDAIQLMLAEDATVPAKLLAEVRPIEQAVRAIARALRGGGRLFYVGAGTSGRLGVLDASECPPTFNTSPDLVQGIIAGGQVALWASVEGAEDDGVAGGRAIEFRRGGPRDVVVGIAASGTTPFVWGALAEARRRRAITILLCFNPYLEVPRPLRPEIVIAPNLGPELLTGSTRLKAGTATKLLLNLFTTLAMVRNGKVMSNLMIDVRASNVKLRARARRIVQTLAGVEAACAEQALEAHRWEIRAALRALHQAAPLKNRG